MQQYTRVSSLWCLHIATYKMRQSLLFVCWFYIQREATHQKACWSGLYAIYFRKCYGRYNDLVHYKTPLSHILCDLVLCWFVLQIPDLILPDMTGYTLDSTADVWPHQDKFILPRHLFSHLGFRDLSVTFNPDFGMIMD